MTRVCMYCGGTVGEKCPMCGSLLLAPYTSIRDWLNASLFHKTPPLRFQCFRCGHCFIEGEGGVTHTVHAKCAAQMLAEKSRC